MKAADISKALSAHLEAANLGETIVWPDQKAVSKDLPDTYLRIEHIPTLRPTANLAGSRQQPEGYYQVTACGLKGSLATSTEQLADRVSDAFPIASKITGTGGHLTILSSRVLPGFSDDVRWRVPVRIDYRAFPD